MGENPGFLGIPGTEKIPALDSEGRRGYLCSPCLNLVIRPSKGGVS
jgi:hypothetical protein